ncbi:hypothetical protein [Arenibaculum pallidiluteum]|uniref:hypothetical protein n=1 Tax=Arenibaculum pallidiluteum TaxID=2812559 RepID=UPI001A963EF8|nr:hypothetical protein [Arenibaculum pallidiluteum]
MAIDIHRILVRKQERDSARLDDFLFRQRARSIRILAEWARGRAPEAAIDPRAFAAQIADRRDAELLAELRALVPPERATERAFMRAFERARSQAYRELVEELGDPTPWTLA